MELDKARTVARVRENDLKASGPGDLLCIALSRSAMDTDNFSAEADRLLVRVQGVDGLRGVGAAELKENFGLTDYEALRFFCAFELGYRAGHTEVVKASKFQVTTKREAYNLVKEYASLEQEVFLALYFDTKGNLVKKVVIHKGTVDASLVRPADVFREAVKQGYPRVIVAHNHPSGDPEPSPEDILVTRDLVKAGEILGIELMDHLIIGSHSAQNPEGFISLKERGYI